MASSSQLISSYKSTVHYCTCPAQSGREPKWTSGWWGELDILPAKETRYFFFWGASRLSYAGLIINEYWTCIYQLVRKMIPTGCPFFSYCRYERFKIKMQWLICHISQYMHWNAGVIRLQSHVMCWWKCNLSEELMHAVSLSRFHWCAELHRKQIVQPI